MDKSIKVIEHHRTGKDDSTVVYDVVKLNIMESTKHYFNFIKRYNNYDVNLLIKFSKDVIGDIIIHEIFNLDINSLLHDKEISDFYKVYLLKDYLNLNKENNV